MNKDTYEHNRENNLEDIQQDNLDENLEANHKDEFLFEYEEYIMENIS